tara:strand:- start:169 stop:348 length:180 start_codon:yes stop_codon:yes gene_type:complete
MKKSILAAALIASSLMVSAFSVQASGYYRFGPSGYTNNYADFSVTAPSGGVYRGTVWGN